MNGVSSVSGQEVYSFDTPKEKAAKNGGSKIPTHYCFYGNVECGIPSTSIFLPKPNSIQLQLRSVSIQIADPHEPGRAENA
jgi:hypothetical protein